ncbi:MAG: protoporphyrinogen oxidase [Nitrospirae bacterium]|nr:protoporphyrinogen oxidase [Nitrospirota bacterium]
MSIAIIGGGISGLSLGYYLLEKEPDLELVILEADKRPGGKIRTDRIKGFLCESGVNGFLDNKPLTLQFIKSISLSPLKSNEASKKRYIYKKGRLYRLPESAGAFISSGLISPCGKGRLLFEIITPRSQEEDETLASFAKRRLGKEAYEMFIDPMASGIYAGDPEMLSIRSCFPRIYQLEKKYGSLFRALFQLQKEAKKTGKEVGPSPGGTLTSFYDGMEAVVSKLKEILRDKIKTSSKVSAIERKNDRYGIYIQNGEEIITERVVLACPAYEASSILESMDKRLSWELSHIPYPPVSVACLGYRIEDISAKLDGFGFLVPGVEKRRILGTLWDSSIFPNRAPEGSVLLRTMVGGARNPDVALQDEEEIVQTVREELDDIMGLDAEPELVSVYKHEKAIPQYNLGHYRIVESVETITRTMKGFYLTGNAYHGIGFNDCIENSYKLSQRILEELRSN